MCCQTTCDSAGGSPAHTAGLRNRNGHTASRPPPRACTKPSGAMHSQHAASCSHTQLQRPSNARPRPACRDPCHCGSQYGRPAGHIQAPARLPRVHTAEGRTRCATMPAHPKLLVPSRDNPHQGRPHGLAPRGRQPDRALLHRLVSGTWPHRPRTARGAAQTDAQRHTTEMRAACTQGGAAHMQAANPRLPRGTAPCGRSCR